MKFLILKRDKLGDLLLTTPLFRALRSAYPKAQIDLLASDYNAWVASGNPDLDGILSYPRVRIGRRIVPSAAYAQMRLFFALRQRVYDVVIVAQGEDSPRAVQRALWAGARRVISYVEPGRSYGRGLTDALAPPAGGHEAQRLLHLLRPLGLEAELETRAPFFRLPEAAAQAAGAWRSHTTLSPQGYVVLGLGARRARKQPTTEQIVRWISHLKTRYGMDTVFMWTPGDRTNPLYPGDDAIAQPVLEANPAGLVPFRGPLLPALGLIWEAQTSLFPDSGLMHFASASPGGVLGLFGDEPAFVEKWAPLGPRSRHLMAPTVSSLEDAAVFAALAALLETPRGVALE